MSSDRIDVHAHYIAPVYREALADAGLDLIGGIPVPPWTPELAIEFMDSHGIRQQVLSVSDPGVGFLAGEEAERLAASCNDYLSEVIAANPDRFSGLALVAGADPDAAEQEARRCLEELDLSGVGLLSSYEGNYLGSPTFEGLLGRLDQMNAWVFVHPTAVGSDSKPDLPIPDFLAEYPFDTTRTFLSLLTNNSFERFPNIRWHFAHGGGTLPMLAARMDTASQHAKLLAPILGMPDRAAELEADSARKALAGSYYDTALIASPPGLTALAQITTAERILFGSDWPFAGLMYPGEGDPQPAIKDAFSPADQASIDRANALRLLNQSRS